MRKLPLLMLFPALLACAGALRAQEPKEKPWKMPEDWIHRPLTDDEKEQIRDRATLRFYDPFSVRFRWGRAHLVETKITERSSFGFQTCVWINSKNLNGAYTGFKPVLVQLFTQRSGKAFVIVMPNFDDLNESTKGKTEDDCREIGISLAQTELEPAKDR
jgi:hypothetical protein